MGCVAASSTQRHKVQEVQDVRVILRRQGEESLGIRFGGKGHMTVIQDVSARDLLARWNQQHPELEVRTGDLILAVNGCTAFMDIVKETQRSGEIELRILPGPQAKRIMHNAASFTVSSGFHLPYRSLRMEDYHELLSATDGPTLLTPRMVRRMSQVSASSAGVTECPICLQDVGPDEMLPRLPCGHCLHEACAEKWLCENKRSCPVCKTPVTILRSQEPPAWEAASRSAHFNPDGSCGTSREDLQRFDESETASCTEVPCETPSREDSPCLSEPEILSI